MFWQLISDLHQIRRLLPGFGTPEGAEVLFWVMKQMRAPRPLKDLYRSSRFSEPTLRLCLRRLADQGFISIHVSDNDERQRCALPTPKLMSAVETYRSLFIRATQEARMLPTEEADTRHHATAPRQWTILPPAEGAGAS